jgi:AcrR family transcriptional regulator
MDTRERILEVAKRLFAKHGYFSTTLDEIASQVGITKPAIYYYFDNKRELYNRLFETYFTGFQLELTGEWERDLKLYIQRVVERFKDRELAKLFEMELSSGMVNLEERVINQIAKFMDILAQILEGTEVNPFFVQTLIISSTVTYFNTLELREKVAQMSNIQDTQFDLYQELVNTIIPYIKNYGFGRRGGDNSHQKSGE